MSEEEFPPKANLSKVMTVGELIEKLKQFDFGLPVMYTLEGGYVREGEFLSIRSISETDLWNQNTDGDPEFYGTAKLVLIQ